MKGSNTNIGLYYKSLSSKFYITEIPVENKKTTLFRWLFGVSLARDVMKIIRTGGCITLLSDFVPIDAQSFFRLLYFEDYAKYAFWTFNGHFIIDLSRNILLINDDDIISCVEILKTYPHAFDEKLDTGHDPEISFCYRKYASLRTDKKFDQMFALDVHNRKVLLDLLEKRMEEIKRQNEGELPSIEPEPTNHKTAEISFLDMLNPSNGSIENTLEYIESKIIEAGFPHNIFHTIEKSKKGANKTGLNSEIAAMVNVFQDNGYFKREFTFKDIFKSFGIYTKNQAGKDYDYSFFDQDYNFKKYLANLKSIEIDSVNLAS